MCSFPACPAGCLLRKSCLVALNFHPNSLFITTTLFIPLSQNMESTINTTETVVLVHHWVSHRKPLLLNSAGNAMQYHTAHAAPCNAVGDAEDRNRVQVAEGIDQTIKLELCLVQKVLFIFYSFSSQNIYSRRLFSNFPIHFSYRTRFFGKK